MDAAFLLQQKTNCLLQLQVADSVPFFKCSYLNCLLFTSLGTLFAKKLEYNHYHGIDAELILACAGYLDQNIHHIKLRLEETKLCLATWVHVSPILSDFQK